jgi:hypothetical protein
LISNATVKRLRRHADLDEQLADEAPSISGCLSAEVIQAGELEHAVADVLAALDVLNHEVNGAVPSERIAAEAPWLPTTLVYAVTEVIRLLRRRQNETVDGSESRALARATWRVETGWSAVLAGDIDHIRTHVDEEEAARCD